MKYNKNIGSTKEVKTTLVTKSKYIKKICIKDIKAKQTDGRDNMTKCYRETTKQLLVITGESIKICFEVRFKTQTASRLNLTLTWTLTYN